MDRNTKIILVLIVIIVILYLLKDEYEYLLACINPGERCVRGRDTCCEKDGEKYVCYQSRCVKENVVPQRQRVGDLSSDFIAVSESRKPLPVETRTIDPKDARPDGAACNFAWECKSKICHDFICRSDLSVDRTGIPVRSSERIETEQLVPPSTPTPATSAIPATPATSATSATPATQQPQVVVIDKKMNDGICTIL